MLIKNNRFAVLPIRCSDCQRYIWLETYRHGEKWHRFIDRFVKVNICQECSERYTFGKQLFCKHDYAWCKKLEPYHIISGETQYYVCMKCKKVKDKRFIRYD